MVLSVESYPLSADLVLILWLHLRHKSSYRLDLPISRIHGSEKLRIAIPGGMTRFFPYIGAYAELSIFYLV